MPLQNGAEAWRRLLVRFDARTIGKEMLSARRVVNPPKIKNLRGTAAHIEKWQECGRKLEQEYGCKVESGLQKAILIEMLPTALMEEVMARLDVNQTFDDVKRLILYFVETRLGFGGVAPMDVGNIANEEQWPDHQEEGRSLENVDTHTTTTHPPTNIRDNRPWHHLKNPPPTCKVPQENVENIELHQTINRLLRAKRERASCQA